MGVERAREILAVHGKAMTLSRNGEGTTISLQGKRIQGATEPTGNSAVQQVFRVKIGPDEIAASAWATKAPLRNDRIVIDGLTRTLLDARPLKHRGVVQLYELTVAG